jgi:hypothetical protein
MANLAANQRRKWAASLGQKIEYRVVPMRYSITAVGADNAELDPSEADTELELPSVPAKAESEVG